MFLSFEHLRQA
jgi:hypothetical protein